jgi:mannose-6-phosphate isomerase-like protein (cupin superfamily)
VNAETQAGVVLQPGEGERVPRGPRYHRILAELPELEAIELCFGPDFEGVDPHSHSDHVDSFYVLDGEAEFTLAEEVVRVGAGAYIAAPVGITHGFRNVGPGELRMLNIHAPNTGFAGRMRRA